MGMRQPGVAGWIIRSEIIESMPFHEVTAAAVLYGDFSAIAVAERWSKVIICFELNPVAG